ncbi:kazal-like domain-containing protein [Caerostris darwini]|uniref:Kazal-like domain-containing protein n=1 Tax=Caerostris darwini TaxID=1538125 RepID=A0AAV4SR11_9ARAC|nr:kazal-like domain-containing protein [Caerostris darwini]
MYCSFGAECLVDEKTQQGYCRCQDSCSDIFAPVCGSDGITYSSECQLRMASCSKQVKIYVQHHGQCDVILMDGDVFNNKLKELICLQQCVGGEWGRRDFPRLPSQLIFSSLFRPRLFSCEQDLEKSVNKGNFRLRRVLCKKPIYLAVSIDDASIAGPDCIPLGSIGHFSVLPAIALL